MPGPPDTTLLVCSIVTFKCFLSISDFVTTIQQMDTSSFRICSPPSSGSNFARPHSTRGSQTSLGGWDSIFPQSFRPYVSLPLNLPPTKPEKT